MPVTRSDKSKARSKKPESVIADAKRVVEKADAALREVKTVTAAGTPVSISVPPPAEGSAHRRSPTADAPAMGRIVHVVLPDLQHRPATIVRTFDNGMINVQVHLDGHNDQQSLTEYFQKWGHASLFGAKVASRAACERGILWMTSVSLDEAHRPLTWHWPERV